MNHLTCAALGVVLASSLAAPVLAQDAKLRRRN